MEIRLSSEPGGWGRMRAPGAKHKKSIGYYVEGDCTASGDAEEFDNRSSQYNQFEAVDQCTGESR